MIAEDSVEMMRRGLLSLGLLSTALAGSISGSVSWSHGLEAREEIAVALLPLPVSADGSPLPLEKMQVQGAYLSWVEESPASHTTVAAATSTTAYEYSFENATGAFGVVAFVRAKGSSAWIDFELPQMGFHTADGCLKTHTSVCVVPLVVRERDAERSRARRVQGAGSGARARARTRRVRRRPRGGRP